MLFLTSFEMSEKKKKILSNIYRRRSWEEKNQNTGKVKRIAFKICFMRQYKMTCEFSAVLFWHSHVAENRNSLNPSKHPTIDSLRIIKQEVACPLRHRQQNWQIQSSNPCSRSDFPPSSPRSEKRPSTVVSFGYRVVDWVSSPLGKREKFAVLCTKGVRTLEIPRLGEKTTLPWRNLVAIQPVLGISL